MVHLVYIGALLAMLIATLLIGRVGRPLRAKALRWTALMLTLVVGTAPESFAVRVDANAKLAFLDAFRESDLAPYPSEGLE
jgi:hypothetical protein